jgi:signal transduction histidine kinase
MLFSNWFAIFSNAATALICTSITLLTLSQLQQDKKSLSLARLMFMLGALTALVVMMRFMALAGQPIHDIFMPITVLTTALPYGMLTFAIDYFEVSGHWRRWVVRLQVIAIIIVAIGCAIETVFRIPVMFNSVSISLEGLVLYDYPYPLFSYFLIGCAYIGFIVSIQTTITQYRKVPNGANRRVLIGMACLALGLFIVPLPVIEPYAFEQILYSIGSLILAVSTLRQRLFDPISQYNAALKIRTERLALIQRVGQRANMRLSRRQLLQEVVSEIQQQFNYHAVAIYLAVEGSQEFRIFSANAPDNELCRVTIPKQMIYLPRLLPQDRDQFLTADTNTHSLFYLPIIFGESAGEHIWLGSLELQSTRINGFSDIDRDVLQILAQQLAIAIRNAKLFEAIQRADDTKADFIAYLSHEIRIPLSVINNTIDFMLNYPEYYEGQRLPDVFQKDAVIISNNTNHLKRLLTDVLDLAKIEAGKMQISIERVDPAPILQQAYQSALNAARLDVEIKALYEKELPFIMADPIRLKQILLNLVSNAAKFTTQGYITLNAQVKVQMLEFSVADTGPGVNEEVLAQLFQPYAQGNRDLARQYGGTGLGLSISRQLVELQGGTIWAESKEGYGTTVRFTIALAEGS